MMVHSAVEIPELNPRIRQHLSKSTAQNYLSSKRRTTKFLDMVTLEEILHKIGPVEKLFDRLNRYFRHY